MPVDVNRRPALPSRKVARARITSRGRGTEIIATLLAMTSGAVAGALASTMPSALAGAASGALVVVTTIGTYAFAKARSRRMHAASIARALETLGAGTSDSRRSFSSAPAAGHSPVDFPRRGGEWEPLERVVADLADDLELRGNIELRERHLFARMLSGMREGVLLLGEDRRVDRMNPAVREMFSLQTGDLTGRSLPELVRNSELKALIDRAFDTRAMAEGEVDSHRRRLLVRATYVENLGVLAVFFDVTEVRALEALRREFVANVSHELRTPVTAVLSAAETARALATRDPEKSALFLEMIERNAERLRRLIEDLLDLSRIESNKLKLSPDVVDLSTFLPTTISVFRERAQARKIALLVDVPAHLTLRVDRRCLEQVITNLVDNAIKYLRDADASGAAEQNPTPSEGASDEVKISVRTSERGVTISVADTGEGIAAEHLPRLFERFYRVDAGRSRARGGTGLGLAIVKHLVEAMGGTIEVASRTADIGRAAAAPTGTTFTVSLPA